MRSQYEIQDTNGVTHAGFSTFQEASEWLVTKRKENPTKYNPAVIMCYPPGVYSQALTASDTDSDHVRLSGVVSEMQPFQYKWTGSHARPIDFGVLHVADVIREFNREYGYASADTMLVKRLRMLELSERQIAGVLTILQTICPDCWDHPKPCECCKDA